MPPPLWSQNDVIGHHCYLYWQQFNPPPRLQSYLVRSNNCVYFDTGVGGIEGTLLRLKRQLSNEAAGKDNPPTDLGPGQHSQLVYPGMTASLDDSLVQPLSYAKCAEKRNSLRADNGQSLLQVQVNLGQLTDDSRQLSCNHILSVLLRKIQTFCRCNYTLCTYFTIFALLY